ncbi:MAG: hypothetical protein KatS3mg038_3832 [Candidatus Kapaibacterium sp.]|jgi:hypothetical protein|nr:MAG: hypothetical protein KatS3mg038_3832 [Candidatus Kapabacteria bacterium]
MIRTHLARGFLLVLLGGMAFTGLERAPIEEQPFVPLTVLLAAIVGGLLQFALAVLSVSSSDSRRMRSIALGINVTLLAVTAPTAIGAFGRMLTGSVTFGHVVTAAVVLMLAFAAVGSIRSVRQGN